MKCTHIGGKIVGTNKNKNTSKVIQYVQYVIQQRYLLYYTVANIDTIGRSESDILNYCRLFREQGRGISDREYSKKKVKCIYTYYILNI